MLLTDPNKAKLALIEKARSTAVDKTDALVKYIDPAQAKNRSRLLADDSGSMMSHFQDLRDGLVEYLRSSIKDQDAVAIHLLCILDENNPMSKLETNLPKLAGLVKAARFGSGGTPLFGRLKDVLTAEPQCNRVVAFTDGSPTDSILEWKPYNPDENFALAFPHEPDAIAIVNIALERKVPIDTIFFGSAEYNKHEVQLLKYIAEKTGGYFLVFDPSKGVSLKNALKYLAPVNRLMLASESVRKEIEEGKR